VSRIVGSSSSFLANLLACNLGAAEFDGHRQRTTGPAELPSQRHHRQDPEMLPKCNSLGGLVYLLRSDTGYVILRV
jgi:hypothetical protein